jgi:hypothetical protein
LRLRWSEYIAATLLSIGLGAVLAVSPTAGLALLIVVVGAASMLAPATYWAIAAVVIAVTGRSMAALGAPGIVSYLDIPIAWAALAAALIRSSLTKTSMSSYARQFLRFLSWFLAAIALSWLFDGSQVQRLVFFVALWGEPWVLIAALLIDPPSNRQRALLIKVLLALLMLQVPITYYQAMSIGLVHPDQVEGTITGSGAAAHLEGALAVIGAMWLVSQRPFKRRYIVFALALAIIPVISGAKQVLVAIPVVLLLAGWQATKGSVFPRIAVLVVCIYGAFFYAPGGAGYGNNELVHPQQSGKVMAAQQIWSKMGGQPVNIMLGLGPAETLSHAAYLTADPVVKAHSPLKSLEIRPSAMALNALSFSHPSHLIDSFHSEDTSIIGLFGDIGVLGILTFGAMVLYIVRRLRATGTPLATGALYAVLLIATLGFVQDWWEEPSVTVFVACIVVVGLGTGEMLPNRLSSGSWAPHT